MRGMFALAAAAAMLTGLPAMAASEPMTAFAKSCQTQMYMSAPACACMVGKAKAELDAKEIAYLSIPGSDGPAAAKAAEGMSGKEILRVDSFMRSATDQCQKAQ